MRQLEPKQLSSAVDQKEAAVARPVGSLEVAILAVDGLDPSGRDVDGLEKTADAVLLGGERDQNSQQDAVQKSSPCRYW